MLTRRLEREGYSNLTTANDGREALELLRSHSFDLVLLDIMMPQMDGYQVLEHLKGDAALRHLPVIMISAVDEIESVIRCIELGAEDYLPKPFNATLLRARVGASLEKKRLRDEVRSSLDRLEHELNVARVLQLSMVPTDIPVPSAEYPLSVYATLQPARQVGGDLYDCFWIAPGRLCLVVADVSDKGASAALYMARTKTALRLLAAGAPDAAELVARVNEHLCQDNLHTMFVTIFLCLIDARTGEVEWCNAGHNPPYLIAPDGAITQLPLGRALPAGVDSTFTGVLETAQLAPGGSLFLFTDGVTEAVNAAKEFFGEDRLEASLRPFAGQAPEVMVLAVLQEVRAFAGAAPPSDDIAMLACRWQGG
jgi:sigma-B regulation protein RsbU (phosphoserine phosphatase)